MGCLLRFKFWFIFCLSHYSEVCNYCQYYVILDRVIMAPHCIYEFFYIAIANNDIWIILSEITCHVHKRREFLLKHTFMYKNYSKWKKHMLALKFSFWVYITVYSTNFKWIYIIIHVYLYTCYNIHVHVYTKVSLVYLQYRYKARQILPLNHMQIVHTIIFGGGENVLFLFVMLMSWSEEYVWYATVWGIWPIRVKGVAEAPMGFNGSPRRASLYPPDLWKQDQWRISLKNCHQN